RRVLGGLLAVNPILWMSSTYGNSAMPSAALLVAAVTILSNRPRSAAEATALALYIAAILLRADAVLAFPLVVLLLYKLHGSVRTIVMRGVSMAVALALIYGLLVLIDPHMADALGGVKTHFSSPAF